MCGRVHISINFLACYCCICCSVVYELFYQLSSQLVRLFMDVLLLLLCLVSVAEEAIWILLKLECESSDGNVLEGDAGMKWRITMSQHEGRAAKKSVLELWKPRLRTICKCMSFTERVRQQAQHILFSRCAIVLINWLVLLLEFTLFLLMQCFLLYLVPHAVTVHVSYVVSYRDMLYISADVSDM